MTAPESNPSPAAAPAAPTPALAAEIHPIFDRVLSRAEREARMRQRGCVIWFYGLSGAGKSTLAVALERRLFAEGFTTQLLDGDNLRTGLNRGLGFTEQDRAENLRRAAEAAKLFAGAGIVTLASFITPRAAHRQTVREIIGADDVLPVYVHASFATCATRDPKGIYARAAAGGVAQFTGKDSAFEPPDAAEAAHTLTLDTEALDPAAALDALLAHVGPRIRFPSS